MISVRGRLSSLKITTILYLTFAIPNLSFTHSCSWEPLLYLWMKSSLKPSPSTPPLVFGSDLLTFCRITDSCVSQKHFANFPEVNELSEYCDDSGRQRARNSRRSYGDSFGHQACTNTQWAKEYSVLALAGHSVKPLFHTSKFLLCHQFISQFPLASTSPLPSSMLFPIHYCPIRSPFLRPPRY